ncbi:leucyl aminopeptidase [Lachnospiraceae bacterium KM106-2]|nr:leucyl aminopeptidase [Lachnospiraceae bacterium KM106-2]
MNKNLLRGAKIVAEKWLDVTKEEALLIVTSENHWQEAAEISRFAKARGAVVEIMTFPAQKGQVGHYFDEHVDAFDAYDVILGATTHSLVTTKAVKRAVERGSRFLSLPLSTNDERSMLEYEFMKMDPIESLEMADEIMDRLEASEEIRVTTEAGTNLTFRKKGRKVNCFTGATREGNGYASSSFEIFIAIEETLTEGVGYVDASLGYIGNSDEPAIIHLKEGRIVEIEQNETGKKLQKYMEHFEDEGMYVAGEFGIGLNRFSNCDGNCYIEDESAYGTFHIGFGRNIALGGVHEAKAHFDLVFHEPNIYADGELIMEKGEIITEEEKAV